jgi:UDP-3-O-[3-hydroxymyristoyl] glucosamine N-acyltransferase
LQIHNIANDPELLSGASLSSAKSYQLSFLEKDNLLKVELSQTKAGALLLPPVDEVINKVKEKGIAWAVLNNPRLGFAESLTLLSPRKIALEGIHPTAVIGENVNIGNNVSIGAHACLGNNTKVGNNSIIHPGVVLYENVHIGQNNELHANCVIHTSTRLGDRVTVHSNAVIGSEGFGFVPTPNGWYKMPQTGIVVLENDVEVGCGSTIDRPAVGETKIGSGTKIDNLVQIGHGVTTGKGCAMAAQVGIAGGAILGNGVILAGQVGVGNRVKVGNHVVASSKCGVHADVPDSEVISGFPAMPNRLWLRCSAHFRRLPEIVKTLKNRSDDSSK